MDKRETEAALKEAEFNLGEAMRHIDRAYHHSPHLTERHRAFINRERLACVVMAVGMGAMAREIGDPTD